MAQGHGPRAFGGPALLVAPRFWGPRAYSFRLKWTMVIWLTWTMVMINFELGWMVMAMIFKAERHYHLYLPSKLNGYADNIQRHNHPSWITHSSGKNDRVLMFFWNNIDLMLVMLLWVYIHTGQAWKICLTTVVMPDHTYNQINTFERVGFRLNRKSLSELGFLM
jgi:hypothetical protein